MAIEYIIIAAAVDAALYLAAAMRGIGHRGAAR